MRPHSLPRPKPAVRIKVEIIERNLHLFLRREVKEPYPIEELEEKVARLPDGPDKASLIDAIEEIRKCVKPSLYEKTIISDPLVSYPIDPRYYKEAELRSSGVRVVETEPAGYVKVTPFTKVEIFLVPESVAFSNTKKG